MAIIESPCTDTVANLIDNNLSHMILNELMRFSTDGFSFAAMGMYGCYGNVWLLWECLVAMGMSGCYGNVWLLWEYLVAMEMSGCYGKVAESRLYSPITNISANLMTARDAILAIEPLSTLIDS